MKQVSWRYTWQYIINSHYCKLYMCFYLIFHFFFLVSLRDGVLLFFQFVMVILKGSVAISFGGNKDPAAYAEVVSMGGINSAVKKELIATLGTILESKLSIPRTRFFLKVYDTTLGRNKAKLWSETFKIIIIISEK